MQQCYCAYISHQNSFTLRLYMSLELYWRDGKAFFQNEFVLICSDLPLHTNHANNPVISCKHQLSWDL